MIAGPFFGLGRTFLSEGAPANVYVVVTLVEMEGATTKDVQNAEAFDQFCRRVSGRLVEAIRLYCGDRGLAEEFAQEALARAYRDWHKVRDLEHPEAWVHRVAINLSRSWFRRVARARTLAAARDHEPPDLGTQEEVRAALLRLPARQRQAVVLRHYADLSIHDTAVAMRCAEGTVRALTSQALTSLRMILEADDG